MSRLRQGQGKYRYAVSDHGSKIHVADKLQTIFRESIVNVDYAQNLVVIHTMSGLANGAAAALDGMEIDQLIGTLAGDDTVLIIMRDTESAAELATSIRIDAALRRREHNMLDLLHIENIAIIEQADIAFRPGLQRPDG